MRECANIISFLDKKMLSINEDVKNYHHDFNGGTDYSDDIDDNSQNINTIPESLKPLYGSIIND